jgi:hypothetical protein
LSNFRATGLYILQERTNMNDAIKSLAEEAAYQTLNEQNPGLAGALRQLIDAGFTTNQIMKICHSKGARSENLLALIGCACDRLQRNRQSEK